MEKVIKVNNLEETIALGNRLGLLLQPNMLLTLSGDLGAGKTTFTKGIGQGLGITKVINSPTFTILKQYQGRLNLSHFDAYRLEGQDDDLGFEDILPVDRLTIEIKKIDENIREFVFKTNSEKYAQVVEALT